MLIGLFFINIIGGADRRTVLDGSFGEFHSLFCPWKVSVPPCLPLPLSLPLSFSPSLPLSPSLSPPSPSLSPSPSPPLSFGG